MKRLFKQKVGVIGSLISLILVMMLLAVFFLALPETLVTVPGRIFAIVWALTAITVFTAHARHIWNRGNYQSRYLAHVKSERSWKQGERRVLRG